MSKKLIYPLISFIAIIIIIFSFDLVFYSRLHKKKVGKNINQYELRTKSQIVKRDNFLYKPIYKDPFISFGSQKDTSMVEKEDEEKKELTLKGIVFGPGKPVGVFQDRTGNVMVVKKGENVNDLILLSVKANSVKVSYKGKNYTLRLWEINK
ncbi:MAG: hypothetical protein B5M53_02790 [Candidatus Cloacimonas sp. 4484_209]|nr:MAG: hypothetical protein B5M53_02790 [Candidatus Cloacimonas sp. 4484_209]